MNALVYSARIKLTDAWLVYVFAGKLLVKMLWSQLCFCRSTSMFSIGLVVQSGIYMQVLYVDAKCKQDYCTASRRSDIFMFLSPHTHTTVHHFVIGTSLLASAVSASAQPCAGTHSLFSLPFFGSAFAISLFCLWLAGLHILASSKVTTVRA